MSDGWQDRAACRGKEELFWPPHDGSSWSPEPAKAICRTCPALAECRVAGREEPGGVWGGELRGRDAAERREAERAKIRRQQRCVECSNPMPVSQATGRPALVCSEECRTERVNRWKRENRRLQVVR